MGFTLTDVLLFGSAIEDIDSDALVVLRSQILQFGATNRVIEVVVSGIPPLSLVGAVADSLTSLKAFGGTKENYGIPTEYTQIDYAKKKGTSGIQGKFDTGIKPTVDDVKIEMKVKIGDEAQASGQTTVGSFYACQARATATSEITGISGSSASGSINGMQNGQSVASGIVRVKDHIDIIRYEYKNGDHSIYVKDLTTNTEDTQTGTYTFSAPTKNLYIFGNTTTTNNLNNNNALYYCKIWVSGSLVFDAVPVIRNSDNLVGLYDYVSGSFIEPIIAEGGGFEAGDITTPTPSDPMDIYCNNGKISVLDHTNWNVIANPNSETGKGMFINTDGKLSKANDRGAGVFIPVTVGKKYTVLINRRTVDIGTIVRYGQSNNGDLPNSSEQLLDWYRGTLTDGMIISFTAKRPYFVMQLSANLVEATGGIDNSVEVIEAAGDNETVAITTRNVFDLSCITDKTYNGITLSVNRNTGEITTTGYTTASAGYSQLAYDLPEPLTAGTYTVSLYNSETMSGSLVGFPINNAVAGRTCSFATNTNNKATITIAEGSEASQIWLRIKGFQDDPTHQFKFKIQVEKGSEGTSYIAHNSSTATANNLFAINTYKDVQEIITGATTHNVNVYVLKGTETWKAENTSASSYCIDKQILGSNSTIIPIKSLDVICTHYPISATESGAGVQDIIWVGGSNVNFKVKATYATLADWKDYLAGQYAAGTPVIIMVPLATPFEEVAPIAQSMTVVDGDNTVSLTQQGMIPLELEVEYTAGVSVTITEIENANIGNDVNVVIA